MSKKSPGKILRDKGLIPKDWKLNKLSGGQKSWITKQAKKYSEIVKKPDRFVSRRVSNATARNLKESGFVVNGNYVVLEAKHGTVKVSKSKLTYSGGNLEYEVFIGKGKDFLKKLEREMRREEKAAEDGDEDGELEFNEVWALQIGDRNPFNQTRSLRSLMNYAANGINWKSPDAENRVSLVKVKIDISTIQRGNNARG